MGKSNSSTSGNDVPNPADEVEKRSQICSDTYIGTAAALIAAGIVEEHVLPGQPGRNKMSVTFQGEERGRCRPGWLQIKRVRSKKFEVIVGVSLEERERRKAAEDARRKTEQQQLAAKTRQLRTPLGNSQMKKAKEAACASEARFKVGDVCIYWRPNYESHGVRLEIVGRYDFYQIADDDDGPYLDDQGNRVRYAWGYLARELGVKEFFYAAHRLRDLDCSIRHLRLVGTAPASTDDHLKPAA